MSTFVAFDNQTAIDVVAGTPVRQHDGTIARDPHTGINLTGPRDLGTQPARTNPTNWSLAAVRQAAIDGKNGNTRIMLWGDAYGTAGTAGRIKSTLHREYGFTLDQLRGFDTTFGLLAKGSRGEVTDRSVIDVAYDCFTVNGEAATAYEWVRAVINESAPELLTFNSGDDKDPVREEDLGWIAYIAWLAATTDDDSDDVVIWVTRDGKARTAAKIVAAYRPRMVVMTPQEYAQPGVRSTAIRTAERLAG